jgi:DNA-binding Xre family transcriptional regulator
MFIIALHSLIGENKLNLRKSLTMALAYKEMSQTELSELIDMSEAGLSRSIKNNKLTIEKLIRICGVFDMKVSEFIALGEDK